MTVLNSSWYVEGTNGKELNPRLKLVNNNSEKENLALLEWAGDHIKLVDLNENDGFIRREKIKHRCELVKALDGNFDVDKFDCSIKGFGTLKEHKAYYEVYVNNVWVSV